MAAVSTTVAVHIEWGLLFFSSGTSVTTAYSRAEGEPHELGGSRNRLTNDSPRRAHNAAAPGARARQSDAATHVAGASGDDGETKGVPGPATPPQHAVPIGAMAGGLAPFGSDRTVIATGSTPDVDPRLTAPSGRTVLPPLESPGLRGAQHAIDGGAASDGAAASGQPNAKPTSNGKADVELAAGSKSAGATATPVRVSVVGDGNSDASDRIGMSARTGMTLKPLMLYYGHEAPVVELRVAGSYIVSRSRQHVASHIIKSGVVAWLHNLKQSVLWMELAPNLLKKQDGPAVFLGQTQGGITGCDAIAKHDAFWLPTNPGVAGAATSPDASLREAADERAAARAAAHAHLATCSTFLDGDTVAKRLLVVGSNDGYVRALRRRQKGYAAATKGGRRHREPDAGLELAWTSESPHNDEVGCLDTVCDDAGDLVISTGGGSEKCNCVKAWDADTGKAKWTGMGHTRGVVVVSVVKRWHPHGSSASADASTVVISGSWDKTLRCWAVNDGRELWVGRGHEGAITTIHSCQLGASGRRRAAPAVFSGSSDCSVIRWDLGDGTALWRATVSTWVSGLDVDVENNGVWVGCGDHAAAALDAASGATQWEQHQAPDLVESVTVDLRAAVDDGDGTVGGRFFAITSGGGISAYTLRPAAKLWVKVGHYMSLLVPDSDRAALNDSQSVVFAGELDDIVCLMASTGREVWRTPAGGTVREMVVMPTSTSRSGGAVAAILSTGAQDAVHGFDIATGAPLFSVAVGAGDVEDPTSRNLRTMVTGGGALFVGNSFGEMCGVRAQEATSDAAAAAGAAAPALVPTIEAREFWRSHPSHRRGIGCLTYSSAFEMLVTGADDRTVRAWRAGKQLWRGTGHNGSVSAVAVHEPGAAIFSAALDGSLIRWSGSGRVANSTRFTSPIADMKLAGGILGRSSTDRRRPAGQMRDGRSLAVSLDADHREPALRTSLVFVQLSNSVGAVRCSDLSILYTVAPTLGHIVGMHITARSKRSALVSCCDGSSSCCKCKHKCYCRGGRCVVARKLERPKSAAALTRHGSRQLQTWKVHSRRDLNVVTAASDKHEVVNVSETVPTELLVWGTHGEFLAHDLVARSGIMAEVVEYSVYDPKPEVESIVAHRRMEGHDLVAAKHQRRSVRVDLVMELATRLFDYLQLISFASVHTHCLDDDSNGPCDPPKALTPIVAFTAAIDFRLMFWASFVLALAFVFLVAVVAEELELRKLQSGGDDNSLLTMWQALNILCRTVSVTLMIPLVTQFLEGFCVGTGTAMAAPPEGDGPGCFEGVHIVYVVVAVISLLLYTPMAFRLLQSQGALDNIEFEWRRPWDWSQDASYDGVPMHAASTFSELAMLAQLVSKIGLVVVDLFVDRLPGAWFNLVLAMLPAAVGLYAPPFIDTSRRLNAAFLSLDFLVVFIMIINLMEAIATEGGDRMDIITDEYMTMNEWLIIGSIVVGQPIVALCSMYFRACCSSRHTRARAREVARVPGAAEILHPRGLHVFEATKITLQHYLSEGEDSDDDDDADGSGGHRGASSTHAATRRARRRKVVRCRCCGRTVGCIVPCAWFPCCTRRRRAKVAAVETHGAEGATHGPLVATTIG